MNMYENKCQLSLFIFSLYHYYTWKINCVESNNLYIDAATQVYIVNIDDSFQYATFYYPCFIWFKIYYLFKVMVYDDNPLYKWLP